MAKGKLFEYAVLFHPKAKKDQGGNDITEPSEIVQSPTVVLAESDREVGMKAARAIPEKYADKLDGVEIVIRPF